MTGVESAIDYPSFEDWLGRYSPDGKCFRDLLEKGALSNLTPFGISDLERCKREIQSVTCRSIFAQDLTFDVVKNYPSNLGAKAQWDADVETGEIASLVLVPSTKASDYAHAAEALARRPGFRPKVMYSDIWPKGRSFWQMLFGTALLGRLGLFHFMQRIIKNMRPTHFQYREAIRDLQACLYRYDDDDEAALIRELKAGNMGNTGHKYSDEEIEELKLSGKFKRRYGFRLKVHIFGFQVIVQKLKNWWVRYKVDNSPGEPPGRGQVDPDTGKKIFTPDQKATINECCVNAEFLSDVLPIEEMYRTVESSSKCNHSLMCHYSNRGESRLESFHEVEAHMANTGMRASLADILSLRGTARFNVRIRERLRIDSLDRDIKERVPAWLRGIPAFYDHSYLAVLNQQAAAVGASCPFPFARPTPTENNGELFLSEYFHAQQRRNKELSPSLFNNRCQCLSCERNPIPLPHEIESAAAAAATESSGNNCAAGVAEIVPEGYMRNPYGGGLVYVGGRRTDHQKKSRVEVTIKKVAATIEEDDTEIQDDVSLLVQEHQELVGYIGVEKRPDQKKTRIKLTVKKVAATIEEDDTGIKAVSDVSVLHETSTTVTTPLPLPEKINRKMTPILPIGHPTQSITWHPSQAMQRLPIGHHTQSSIMWRPFPQAMQQLPIVLGHPTLPMTWRPSQEEVLQQMPPIPPYRKRVREVEVCCHSFAFWAIHRRTGRPTHDQDCNKRKKKKY
jgi:hypothetical protein